MGYSKGEMSTQGHERIRELKQKWTTALRLDQRGVAKGFPPANKKHANAPSPHVQVKSLPDTSEGKYAKTDSNEDSNPISFI